MSNRTNGDIVRLLEERFASYVGAKYGIACCNGTATLHTALVSLGVKPGDRVAVPPLTMASTTLAVLHAGATPVYIDVNPDTWVMDYWEPPGPPPFTWTTIPVSLYGLWSDSRGLCVIDDAAQTLNPHKGAAFTSYSFQASKIISAGEGGMLVTNDPDLYAKAMQFRDLGYPANARANMKHPNAIRHTVIGWNYRMSDCQASRILMQLPLADQLLQERRYSASCYRQAIQGVDWITSQHVPEGWPHSYWTYAIALKSKDLWEPFVAAIELHGGERPYAAWRVTYLEPAFSHLGVPGLCPVAEDLQPRLVQLQTNHDHSGSERAAEILRKAIDAIELNAQAVFCI